jgi:hypothetical protein
MDKKQSTVNYSKQAVKKCPYCARMVLDTALVCGYCRRPLLLPVNSNIGDIIKYSLITAILVIIVLIVFPPRINSRVHIQQEQLPLRERQPEARQKENPEANLKQMRQEQEWQLQQFHKQVQQQQELQLQQFHKQVRQEQELQLQQLHKQVREEERARNDTREIDAILNKAQNPL